MTQPSRPLRPVPPHSDEPYVRDAFQYEELPKPLPRRRGRRPRWVLLAAAGAVVVLLALANPPAARLIVTDRGPGVPEQDLGRIFEPFYRSPSAADAQGFGLGLAIAQRAITVHAGSIVAANDPGGGLRMEIQLPLA